MAEGGTEPKSIDGQISRGQLEINECLGNWLTYLQVGMLAVVLSLCCRTYNKIVSRTTDT